MSMNMTSQILDKVLQELVAGSPLGLFCDLDGTLAPVAPTPEAVRVQPSTLRLLKALARQLSLLAIVSGRDVSTMRQMLPLRGIAYVGNHGLEFWHRGKRRLARGATAWKSFMSLVLQELAATPLPPGAVLESKALTLSIHYRPCPEGEQARLHILNAVHQLSFAQQVLVSEGRKVVELRPALPIHKGTAVEALIKENHLQSAIYLGDDTTDIQAFLSLRRLKQEGQCQTLTVAVYSEETPQGLLNLADHMVNGTQGAMAFLRSLRKTLGQRL